MGLPLPHCCPLPLPDSDLILSVLSKGGWGNPCPSAGRYCRERSVAPGSETSPSSPQQPGVGKVPSMGPETPSHRPSRRLLQVSV